METSKTVTLYVTFVEKEGPFLKLWGQTERVNPVYIERVLLEATPQYELGVGKVLLDNLPVGTLIAAKYKDNTYYRARITNVSFLHEGFVEVSFLDYGNKDIVPSANIRSLQNFPPTFISLPPLAIGFIFAEAHCPGGGEWNDTVFDNISKEIKYQEFQCTLLTQATQYYLVKLFAVGGHDLGRVLISRGLMQPISLQAQQAVLLSMSMRPNIPQQQPTALTSVGINTYKASVLEPGCQYPVYVSYVNDGPCHFSVQLKQSEDILVMLMNDINTIPLRLLEDVPIPGTICLARCQEDGNVCRAVVTNEVDNQFKVFYVDFGNYEIVPLDALYQIPFKFVLPKVMAIRFALAGVEKSTVTIEMQCGFKQFVDNRLLHMKVLPAPTRMAIPKCELWDPETKTSALDVVIRAAQNAYPEPMPLNRGFSQLVKISYVFSCNRFYVQLASKENELLKLMLDLQATCLSNEAMDPSILKVGLPCCALFEADQQWYRSQIVEVLGESVKVRYIDYGNEELVPSLQLKIIDGEQLTVLRPQAIECCLNGYQNMEVDSDRDGFLEELILEEQFTMKVVEMVGKKALVELFNESKYNVASLLLDKLAAAKSQVSPMLVQAGNKIEHRKSQPHQNGPRDQNFRQDRNPERENKGWNDKSNDRNEKPWRQDNRDNRDNRDFRNHDKNTNENTNDGNSWRHNNKGFSPNNEKYNNRNRNNESNNNWDNTTNSKTQSEDKVDKDNDDWNTPQNNAGYKNKHRDNDFGGRNNDRFDHDKPKWNSEGHKSGGYRSKGDYKKDGNESSGSEKSFNKGPRTSSRNDRGNYNQKFDKPRNTSFNTTKTGDDSWNVSAVTPPIDAAPATAIFVSHEVVGTEKNVIISWFHDPSHFYCQLSDSQEQIKTMMTEIQQFYKDRKPQSSVVGAPVIGLFPEDNVLYRAQVLEVVGAQYKVFYVDFGNVSTINKVWPIEKKFMQLPAQAIVCSLYGVAPLGDNWPHPDNYSKWFDKEAFTCQFINKDETKTYVNLFCGSEDVMQLLIKDGLAISTQQSIPNIEIPLLIGQQFRAVLKSINNLGDMILALECGLAVSCMMHNLETATETFDDEIKSLLEQTVIVYVDNIVEDRLEITLYDLEGTKLNVLNPDEGAFDTVEPLCPLLILRSTLTGWVSHVDDKFVFIQPSECSETVAYLLEQMFEFYEKLTQELPLIPEEGMLYAVHSEDGNWYRARVVTFDDEKALVSYVDYGNSENVAFSELRELFDIFLEISILCVQVLPNVPTNTLAEKEVEAVISIGENGWEGTVEPKALGELSTTESAQADVVAPIMTEITDEPIVTDTVTAQKIVLNESYVEESLPTESDDLVLRNNAEALTEEKSVPQKGTQVLMSHIDSPNEFYLQFAESLNDIDELQRNLQEQVADMPVLEIPTAGVLCAAPYSGDQQWYRAEVLDADDDITTVRFVDYGNTDVIDNDTTAIKTLPPTLLSLAVYASRSSLKLMPTDTEWSSSAIEKFEALTNVEYITAEFTDQNEKTNYVELYANGENIKDILIQENLAVPVEFTVESKSTCFVSHLNSPSEFWIQLENCVTELEWVAGQLEEVNDYNELEDLAPGTLCAALFPDDEMWYRARILSNTVAGIELLFIDYGNSCMSNSLKELPEQLVVIQPLAQKCSLQKPEGIPYWSPQAINKFKELAADGQTIFSLHKISTGETSVIQLLVEGEDVVSMLMPITENGYVKNVENLDSFNVEISEGATLEKCNLETLPGIAWDEESSEKFEELNKQGSTPFQIEFVSERTVRLYLNGTDIRNSLGGSKIVPLNVSKSDEGDKTECKDTSDVNIYLDDTIPNEKLLESTECEDMINATTNDIEEGIKTKEDEENEGTTTVEENNTLKTLTDEGEVSEVQKSVNESSVGEDVKEQKSVTESLEESTSATTLEDEAEVSGEQKSVDESLDDEVGKKQKSLDESAATITLEDDAEVSEEEKSVKEALDDEAKDSQEQTYVRESLDESESTTTFEDAAEVSEEQKSVKETLDDNVKVSDQHNSVKESLELSTSTTTLEDEAEASGEQKSVNESLDDEVEVGKKQKSLDKSADTTTLEDDAEVSEEQKSVKETLDDEAKDSQEQTSVRESLDDSESTTTLEDDAEVSEEQKSVKETLDDNVKVSDQQNYVKESFDESESVNTVTTLDDEAKDSQERTSVRTSLDESESTTTLEDEADIREEQKSIKQTLDDEVKVRDQQESVKESLNESESVNTVTTLDDEAKDSQEPASAGESLDESESNTTSEDEAKVGKKYLKESLDESESFNNQTTLEDEVKDSVQQKSVKEVLDESESFNILATVDDEVKDIDQQKSVQESCLTTVPTLLDEAKVSEQQTCVKKTLEFSKTKSNNEKTNGVEVNREILEQNLTPNSLLEVQQDKDTSDLEAKSNDLSHQLTSTESGEGHVASDLAEDLTNLDSTESKTRLDVGDQTDNSLSEDNHILDTVLNSIKDSIKESEKNLKVENSIRSGKISHDDRILPGVISRPQTPSEQDIPECESEGLTGSEVAELLRELVEKTLDKTDQVEISSSRPHSSGSGKLNYDDRIVPAALSRPQSPLPLSDEN